MIITSHLNKCMFLSLLIATIMVVCSNSINSTHLSHRGNLTTISCPSLSCSPIEMNCCVPISISHIRYQITSMVSMTVCCTSNSRIDKWKIKLILTMRFAVHNLKSVSSVFVQLLQLTLVLHLIVLHLLYDECDANVDYLQCWPFQEWYDSIDVSLCGHWP